MNTLEDLRASLGAHASIADDGLIGRNAALHTRIRRARTQRRAGIAGGVAAAVLIAGGVVAGIVAPSHHGAASLIAGHAVEAHTEVYGFGYDLVDSAQSKPGQQRFTFQLPKTDRGRAVALVATGLGSGTATLSESGTDLSRVTTADEIAGAVPVGSDKESVLVTLHDAGSAAQVGLAVYGRDDTLPAGVSNGHVVFRQERAGSTLLGGAWGKPGQSEVTFTFDVTKRVPIYSLTGDCTLPGKDSGQLMVTGSVDGDPTGGVGCGDSGPLDEDAGGSTATPDKRSLGVGRHTVTLRLEDEHGHPMSNPDVVLGGAIYAPPSPRWIEQVMIDPDVEFAGRNWVLDSVVPADNLQLTGPALVSAILPSGKWAPTATPLTPGDRDLELGTYDNAVGSSGLMTLGQVLQGSTYRFMIPHPKDPTAKIRILVYRPAD